MYMWRNDSKVQNKIKDNPIIRKLYRLLFYFELGKGTIGRMYQFIPDIIIILGGMKYLLDIDVTRNFVIIFGLIVVFGFTLIGLVISKTGLYEVDKYVQASKDPVQTELLNAARRINKNGKRRYKNK